MKRVKSIKKNNSTARYDIIVIGASMGGFEALRQLINEFPANLPASVFVVLHIASEHESRLASVFGQKAKLPVVPAKDHDLIKRGQVYIAVPDFHLRIDGRHILLDHGPKHNFHRPAADTLFSSAAKEYGPRVVGVVLTGALDDGTAGLMDIKRFGGITIVQDPADAVNPSMPNSALSCVPIDHCVPISEMGRLLSTLAGQRLNTDLAKKGKTMFKPSQPELSSHICPECNGPMWWVETGKLLHFCCRIGHAFSGQSLLVKKTEALESALWSAVNALKDKADISIRLAQRLRGKEEKTIGTSRASYFQHQAENAETHAKTLIEMLLKQTSPTALTNKNPRSGKKTAHELPNAINKQGI
jgi:two-component system chemotaxis response regulator CheB